MKISKWMVLTAAGAAILPLNSRASALPELSSYFDKEIAKVESTACTMEAESPGSIVPKMVLSDVNIDLQPSVSFGVDSVLSLSIAPEVDLILTPQ